LLTIGLYKVESSALKKSFSQSKSDLYDIGLQLRIPKIKKEKSIIGNNFKF